VSRSTNSRSWPASKLSAWCLRASSIASTGTEPRSITISAAFVSIKERYSSASLISCLVTGGT
jgi:hypothetical protein